MQVQQQQQPQFLPPGAPVQNGFHTPPVERPQPIYNKIKRAPGRGKSLHNPLLQPHVLTISGIADALITSLHLRSHPHAVFEGKRFNVKIEADPVYAQHSTTVHIPGNQSKLQLIPVLAPLEQQDRAYRLFVVVNGSVQHRQVPLPIPGDDLALTQNSLVFDANLGMGMNEIQVHIVAALPKGQKLPGGEDCEVEVFKLVAQLVR